MAREVPTEQIALVGPIPAEVWIPLNSTWVQAARYHPQSQSFDIRTKDGAEYPNYPNCPPEKFRGLLLAPSKGAWLWQNYPPRRHR